jgi:hypothetical protein
MLRAVDGQLLGFDARDVSSAALGAWQPERRSRYLLRADVARPRSADDAVWPSVLAEANARGAGARGSNGSLWDSFEVLTRALRKAAVPTDHFVLVSVTVPARQAPGARWAAVDGAVASSLAWRRCGYDVCDGFLLSGLMNCGYTDAERRALAMFVPSLNEHHLFEDEDTAALFASRCDERVPEHAPFLPVAVWALT